jgi:hypothetical protein
MYFKSSFSLMELMEWNRTKEMTVTFPKIIMRLIVYMYVAGW